ncbi:hypothetical protein SAMN05421692_1128 [Chryseobacterium indologenes]|nr:hypothetical protein SAMN05421692_1128 [Chryseobacterium indologenes]SUX49278.1 Uncharacterised protein [Chryseobacterium indologenes]
MKIKLNKTTKKLFYSNILLPLSHINQKNKQNETVYTTTITLRL